MSEYVKTKKRFIELVNQMEKPMLCYGIADKININMWFLVKDDTDRNKSFNLPGCSYKNNEPVESYDRRELKLHVKYENWIYFACGEYYQVQGA